MVKLSFGLQERLKGKKRIEELFGTGSAFRLHPFKVLYQINQHNKASHQVLFAAPGRYFKKAVDRNKIKRRTREAYRLQKSKLSETPALVIGFIYTSREIEPYQKIHQAMGKAMQQINKRLMEAAG